MYILILLPNKLYIYIQKAKHLYPKTQKIVCISN